MSQGTVVNVERVMPYQTPAFGDEYLSRMLIDKHNAGSEKLQINHGLLKAGCALPGCEHPPPHDEVYIVLKGEARLNMGNQAYTLKPGSVVFIPGGTFHALSNSNQSVDFEFFTVWPGQPAPGANEVYDGRIEAWGTSYREVEAADDAS